MEYLQFDILHIKIGWNACIQLYLLFKGIYFITEFMM